MEEVEEEEEAAMAVSLPDDILLEILVRLRDDAAALFRCATTCKGWCRLLLDRSFLRRCWPSPEDSGHSSFSFIGFLTKDDRRRRRRPEEKGWLVLLAPRSPLGRGCRPLGSFFPAASAGVLEGARPLASHHGLLLLTLAGNSSEDNKVLQLAVCNLLLGTCHVLPPLHIVFSSVDDNLYAVLTTAADDCASNQTASPNSPTFFKVLVLRCHEDDYEVNELKYNLHTISSSSDKAMWNMSTAGCLDIIMDEDGLHMMSRAATVHRGTAQWMFCNLRDLCFYRLNINAHTYHISVTKLPFMLSPRGSNYPCLHQTVGGAAAVLQMQEKGSQLQIWEQQNKLQWICTRIVKLKQAAMEDRELHIIGGNCTTLFVTDQKRVYTAELETETMEEVVEWPHMRHLAPDPEEVVFLPLEMYWPTIFLSQIRKYLS